MLHHPRGWEGGRRVSWSCPNRSCCAQGSQLTPSCWSLSPPPACQHQPLPPPWPLGWSRSPRRGTTLRLTPLWMPGCCLHCLRQHLILVLHPGKGRQVGQPEQGPHIEISSTQGCSPPHLLHPRECSCRGQTRRGTWDGRTGWRPQQVGLSTSSYTGNPCLCTCAQAGAGGPYLGLGTQRLAGKGEGSFLQSLEPCCPPQPSWH